MGGGACGEGVGVELAEEGAGGDGEGFFWEAGLAVIFYDDEGVHANVYILILTEPIVIVRYLRVNN